MLKLPDLVAAIQQHRSILPRDRSLLVAVSGIDGSGKGYTTAQLVTALNQQGLHAVNINLDAWLTLPSERFNTINPGEHFYRHAFHFEALFDQLIEPLRHNRSVHLVTTLTGEAGIPFTQTYDFDAVEIIVLEGIFLLKQELRHRYDLSIWVDCSFETALERALKRNQEGLSPAAIRQVYFPAQRSHLATDNPRAAADLIYLNDPTLLTRSGYFYEDAV